MGFRDGPVILSINGKVLRATDVNNMIHEVLIDIFNTNRSLLPADIIGVDLIAKHYQCFEPSDIPQTQERLNIRCLWLTLMWLINIWKAAEKAKGRVPGDRFSLWRTGLVHFTYLCLPVEELTSAM